MNESGRPRTLFAKIWDTHVVESLGDGMDLVWIDRHFLHDLSGPFSLQSLANRGLPCRHPELTFATPDHGVATTPGRTELSSEVSAKLLPLFRDLCAKYAVELFDLDDPRQGIVHVVAAELGLSLPGSIVVCGDSHTCTQGGLGAVAWGIGNTEITQVLATQTLMVERPRTMRVRCAGALSAHVDAKDLILHVIAREGADAGSGHAVEYAGPAVEALPVEGRMTLCNLSVEMGAKMGFVAADETVFAYLRGRPGAPREALWEQAVAHWQSLRGDPGASFDREVAVDASEIAPQMSWGTSPAHTIAVDGIVPQPEQAPDRGTAKAWGEALDYMGLQPGSRLEGLPIQHVFIGSCTNSRLSDLESAAAVVRGRQVAAGVRAWVVPGSQSVKRAAEARGLDGIFKGAGFEWREPGCSMCIGMNGEQVPPGERCVSTSNRNFVGRQGPGARTHLASPASAAACAVAGAIADVRKLATGG